MRSPSNANRSSSRSSSRASSLDFRRRGGAHLALGLLAAIVTIAVTPGAANADDLFFDNLESSPSGWSFYTTNPQFGSGDIGNSTTWAHSGSHYGWQYFAQGSYSSDWEILYKTFTSPSTQPIKSCYVEVFFRAPTPLKGSIEMIDPTHYTYIASYPLNLKPQSGYSHVAVPNVWACSRSIIARVVLQGGFALGGSEILIDDVSVNFHY